MSKNRLAYLVCLLLVFPRVVGAHGGGVAQVVNRPISTLTLSAWSSPDPAEAGTLHITVALADSANEPVLNQAVIVELVGDGGAFSAEATHDNAANKLFYEADFDDIPVGQWDVMITLADSDDTITFPLETHPKSFLSTGLFGLIALGIVGIVWLTSRKK